MSTKLKQSLIEDYPNTYSSDYKKVGTNNINNNNNNNNTLEKNTLREGIWESLVFINFN
jgi:hypothetical protein